MSGRPSYPWSEGDALFADELNAAIGNASVGALTGTITQSYTSAMSGAAYPPGPVGLNQHITLTGTVTDGFAGAEGHSMPLNLLQVTDQLAYTFSPGGKIGQEIKWDTYGGAGNVAGQYTVVQFLPAAGYPFVPGTQFKAIGGLITVNGNVTGGTAGGPANPDFYGGGIEVRQQAGPGSTPTFTNMLIGLETDVTSSAPAGSAANYVWGIKIGMGGSGAIAPSNQGAFLTFNGSGNGDTKVPYGILFDNLQSHSPPIATTGTAIYTHAATMLSFIDASAATFTGPFIKGPNGFAVDNTNTVHTDTLFGVAGAGVTLYGAGGRVGFLASGGASAVNYIAAISGDAGTGPLLRAQSQGSDANIDISVQPIGTGQFNIAGTAATTATAPASLSANRRVQIKINGTSYWLPLATVAW